MLPLAESLSQLRSNNCFSSYEFYAISNLLRDQIFCFFIFQQLQEIPSRYLIVADSNPDNGLDLILDGITCIGTEQD